MNKPTTMDRPLSVEEQLRTYADSIDPAVATRTVEVVERLPMTRARRRLRLAVVVGVAAASLVALVAAGMGLLTGDDEDQRVETVTDAPSTIDALGASEPLGARSADFLDAPLTWRDGTGDPIETAERFLDLHFPEWRLASPRLDVLRDIDPDVAEVQLLFDDGSLLATLWLLTDGDSFVVQEVHSPVIEVGVRGGGLIIDEIRAGAAGTAEVDSIDPVDRSQLESVLLDIPVSAVGDPLPLGFASDPQEVHATLRSPSGSLLGVAAFSIPLSIDGRSVTVHGTSSPRPDPFPDSLPPEPFPPDVGTYLAYIVEPGDSLSHIAAKFQTTIDALLESNTGINPNELVAGQEILIDWANTGTGPSGPPPTPSPLFHPTREDSLAVHFVESEMVEECLRASGMDYVRSTTDELAELYGEWKPNGILGIGRGYAARTIGYHAANWGGLGSPTQSAAYRALSDHDQELQGQATQACRRNFGGAFSQNHELRLAQLWNQLFGTDETQGGRFGAEPDLAGALDDWRDCMLSRIGDTLPPANTPNELARQFAFLNATSDREREIAVADVACQRDTNLEAIFYQVQSRVLRSELGPDQHLLDEYELLKWNQVVAARSFLKQRGLAIPSLH